MNLFSKLFRRPNALHLLAFIFFFNIANSYSQSNALHFNGDGSDDILLTKTTVDDIEGTNLYTMELWIKPESFGTNMNLLMANGSFNFSIDALGKPYLWNGTIYTSTATLSLNQWSHVAVTSNGTEIKFYVNGQAAGTTLGSNNISAGTTYGIGANVGNHGTAFIGSIDELRVWNVARTQTQIVQNLGNSLATGTGLMASYDFNSGIAGGTNTGITTLMDMTGNGNVGTLFGFALSGSTSNWVSSPVPTSFNYALDFDGG
jgi:hypothetical protein